MKLLTRLEKSKDFWFLISIIFIFFLLRLPSLFEPYWYGDEGIYQVIGMALNQDRLLYRDIWDNKPPLLYLLYAIFPSDQFAIRSVSLFFGVASIVAFWGLAKQLFQGIKIAVFFSTGFFAVTFALPLLEGNIANAENFMLLPIILAGFFIYTAQTHNHTLFAAAGFLLSLAFLFKIVAIFDFVALTLFLIYSIKNKKTFWEQEIKSYLVFFIAFVFPIVITGLFFFLKGAFSPFMEATLQQNVGYVGYGNQLFVPQGLLLTKLLLLFLTSAIIFAKRNRLTKAALFIFIWFIFSLFNAFFSGRPYTHYLLTLLPSFSLLLGLFYIKTKTVIYKKALAVVLVATLFLIATNFTLYLKILPYYKNYLDFITNKKTVSQYQSFFDRNTPVDYAIASFLRTRLKEKDTVFIWGNNGQVYAMINKLPPGRFIVAYHMVSSIKTVEETKQVFMEKKPTYVVLVDKQPIPFSLTNYKERIIIYNTRIYERQF